MDDNRDHILKTGISILQLDQAIEWDEGDKDVLLVIGIAAQQDEHINVLANLAEVIEQEEILAEMIQTRNAEVFIKYLDAKRELE